MNFRNFSLVIAATLLIVSPVLADTASDPMTAAGGLYSKSVDLANAGNYPEALADADQALAMNVTSLIPLIQSNRAGILVMLGRYDEAIAAADVAIGAEGNLTTTQSIAWYNKGNALKELGRIDEARTAFARASALDPTLMAPALPASTATASLTLPAGTPSQVPTDSTMKPATAATTAPGPAPTRSPLSPAVAIGAVLAALVCFRAGCR